MPSTFYYRNPYGATVGTGGAIPVAKNAQVMADLKAQGATWCRYQFNWNAIDPNANGDYTAGGAGTNLVLTGMDDVVSKANAYGINLILTIQKPPGDASLGTGYFTQNVIGSSPNWYLPSASKSAAFGQFIATRYNGGAKGSVQGIEFGNEDYDLFVNQQWVKDHGGIYLANTLVAGYPLVKAANPPVIVFAGCLLGGSTTHVQNWLTQLQQGSGTSNCDVITFHFYKNGGSPPSGQPPETSVGITTYYQTIANQLTSLSVSLPIAMTEFGYGLTNVDQATQATYEVYEIDTIRKLGASYAFYYTLGKTDTTTDDKTITQHGWDGLPETYNPAFTAIQNEITQYPQWNVPSVRVPAVSRRSGSGIVAVARRNASGTPATKRRDGAGVAATGRRNAVGVPTTVRRDGAVPVTQRRG